LKIVDKISKISSSYPGLKKYFYNTAWMFAEKGLRLVAGLLVGAVVARYLGPEQFGLLNYAISFVGLFAALSTLGLDQILIRELVRDGKAEKVLLGTAFLLRFAGSFFLFVILVCIIWVSDTDHQTSVLLYFIALGIFFDTMGVIDYYFQSQIKSKYVAISQMVSLVCLSIFRLILVFCEASLFWFAFAYLLDFMILATGLIYFYSKNASIFRWRFSFEKAKSLLQHSWPLMIASLAVGLYARIDQVMVNWIIGNEASGIYSVAVRLSELWYFIPIAICGSLFPSIINSKLSNEDLYRERLQMLYDLMVVISLAIAVLMTFLSGFIVETLYGEAYKESGPILAIYVWAGVFVFLGVAVSKSLTSENMQKFQMISTAVGALMNIIFNLILIKSIGLMGAAISTLISYSFPAYFVLLFSKRTRPMFKDVSKSLNLFRLIKTLRTFRKNF
jgi:O-antigen/teichoic acid export membrane protein